MVEAITQGFAQVNAELSSFSRKNQEQHDALMSLNAEILKALQRLAPSAESGSANSAKPGAPTSRKVVTEPAPSAKVGVSAEKPSASYDGAHASRQQDCEEPSATTTKSVPGQASPSPSTEVAVKKDRLLSSSESEEEEKDEEGEEEKEEN